MRPETRIVFRHPEKTGGRSTIKALLLAVCRRAGFTEEAAWATARTVQSGAAAEKIIRAGLFYLSGPNSFIRASHHCPPPRRLNENVFRFRLIQFREPLSRLASYYRMLKVRPVDSRWNAIAGDHPPTTWREFAENVPPSILLGQVRLLSPAKADPVKAMAVLTRIDHVLFLDRYDAGIAALGRKLDLPELRPVHVGANPNTQVSAEELLADATSCRIIRERAAKEFEFWNLLMEWRDA